MKKLPSLLLLACLAGPLPALAGGNIVFDPSNFSKNTITAAQTIRQTAIQANQLATQTQQYMLQVRNLRQVPVEVINQGINRGYLPVDAVGLMTPADVLKSAGGVYSSYRQTVQEMDAMQNTYAKLDSLWSDISNISTSANVTPERLLEVEARAAAQGRAMADSELERLQESLGQLEHHQQRADLLASQLPQAGGTVELLQTIGAQNHLLSDQVTQLIQVGASAAQAAQQEALLRARERERSAEVARQATERNRKIYDQK